MAKPPLAVSAAEVEPRAKSSIYPEPFRSRMTKREKRVLGDVFGLRNFGVNLTRLDPGGVSALLHRHSLQDEFVYVLEGCPTLVTDEGEVGLRPGDCAGFRAGTRAHHLMNRTRETVLYLEIGDRTPGDEAVYPEDDICAYQDESGSWIFTRKDGRSY